jgi:hypothetical protein
VEISVPGLPIAQLAGQSRPVDTATALMGVSCDPILASCVGRLAMLSPPPVLPIDWSVPARLKAFFTLGELAAMVDEVRKATR